MSSAVITQGIFPKLLVEGLRKISDHTKSQLPVYWDKMYTTEISSKKAEEYLMTAGLGMAQVMAEGEAVPSDIMQQVYVTRIANLNYGVSFSITSNMLEDNQHKEFALQKTRSLTRAVLVAREVDGALVFDRAFNSSYLGGDGLELCSAAHVSVFGTWNNELDTAADLSEVALEQAMVDVADFRDERGIRMNISANRLIVPNALIQFDAKRILGSSLQPDSAQNNINALKAMGYLPGGFSVNRYLGAAKAWFLITDAPDGLIYQSRKEPELSQHNEWDTENIRIKILARWAFKWHDPRAVFGSPGA